MFYSTEPMNAQFRLVAGPYKISFNRLVSLSFISSLFWVATVDHPIHILDFDTSCMPDDLPFYQDLGAALTDIPSVAGIRDFYFVKMCNL